MDYRRYLKQSLTITVLLVLAATAANVLIDPYAIFGTRAVAGVNALKPHAGDRGRVTKLHQVLRVTPRIVIVGNSRPEMGLDPQHACWPAHPVYNLSVPGLTVFKQIRYAQHALAGNDVSLVMLGADFLDFIDRGAAMQQAPFWPVASEDVPVQVDFDGNPRRRWQLERNIDRFRAAASLEALADSMTTVLAQRRTHTQTRTPLGFFPAANLYMPIIRNEGTVALFMQKNRQIAARLTPDLTLFGDSAEWSADLEALHRFLAQQADAGRAVVIYINPYHAEYLLMIRARGLWPGFERWKRELARLGRTFDVPVYDFALFDSHATEPVESVAARGAALQWFWEPSHYRKQLGDKMIETMFAEACPGAEREFGVLLNATDIDGHLTAIRGRRDDFVAAYPETDARLRAMFDAD